MATTHESIDMFPLHRVPVTRPFIWLSEGWDDLWHHPQASLAYGALTVLLGSLILAYDRHPVYIATTIAAFLLVGPIITAGICELSRSRDHGEETNFGHSLKSLRPRRSELMHFAETLLFIAVAGFGITALALYSTTGSIAPALESTLWGDVMAQLSRVQRTAYLLSCTGLAGVVFALSVVTVPMIIDRHVDAGTAMHMSLLAALRDFPAMLVWALLIIALVAFGFATKLIGMVLVLPLLGHATWNAYRDIVEEA